MKKELKQYGYRWVSIRKLINPVTRMYMLSFLRVFTLTLNLTLIGGVQATFSVGIARFEIGVSLTLWDKIIK